MEHLSLSNVEIDSIGNTLYLKPLQMEFTLNGFSHCKYLIETHAGVSVVIFNITRNVLILIRQFRPAVYYARMNVDDRDGPVNVNKHPVESGITLEVCAGVVDKNLPLEEIAREEILEECGYDVPVNRLQRIVTFPTGFYSVDPQTLYYCEVTDEMKLHQAIEYDTIEVVEMSISEVRAYVKQTNLSTPPLSLFGIYWFLYNKAPLYEKKINSKL